MTTALATLVLHISVLSQPVTPTPTHCFPTISDLRESIAVPSDCVHVLGYDVPGDGGGGVFWWHPGASGTDDGGTVISSRVSGEAWDLFGKAMTAADFDNDGYTDLAVGAPWETIDAELAVGAVYLFRGSPSWLVSDRQLTQLPGDAHDHDFFGWALASGDFNADGAPELVVGAPQDRRSGSQSGAIFVFDGASDLSTYQARNQGPFGEDQVGDYYGAALSVADYDSDGFDDLAVGAPRDRGAGRVFLRRGNGSSHVPLFVRSFGQESLGSNEAGDSFGHDLVSADFNGDGFAELVVGAPEEAIGEEDNSGAVFLYEFSGSPSLLLRPVTLITQTGVSLDEENDYFGSAFAVGDFDGDGRNDLAVGVYGLETGPVGARPGAVYTYSDIRPVLRTYP